jgi:hypothetical protein
MFRSGYLTIGRWRGAPIKLHWSIPVAAVVLNGFQFRPGILLAFTLLILIHELGHAVMVRLLGHRVVAVEVTGLGGLCHWSGNASPFEDSLIAWGGVLAQLLLWFATTFWLWFGLDATPPSAFVWDVIAVFTSTNLWLMALNLIPLEPLDGARAWKIFGAWRDRGPGDLPYGTWRDHSRHAQLHWYDRLRGKSRAKKPPKAGQSAARGGRTGAGQSAARGGRTGAGQSAARGGRTGADPADATDNRPLSDEGRRAIDDLLRHTTGKVSTRPKGDKR